MEGRIGANNRIFLDIDDRSIPLSINEIRRLNRLADKIVADQTKPTEDLAERVQRELAVVVVNQVEKALRARLNLSGQQVEDLAAMAKLPKVINGGYAKLWQGYGNGKWYIEITHRMQDKQTGEGETLPAAILALEEDCHD